MWIVIFYIFYILPNVLSSENVGQSVDFVPDITLSGSPIIGSKILVRIGKISIIKIPNTYKFLRYK